MILSAVGVEIPFRIKIEEFSYYLLKNYENRDIRNLEYPNLGYF